MAAAPTDILVPNAVLPERDWRPHATLLVVGTDATAKRALAEELFKLPNLAVQVRSTSRLPLPPVADDKPRPRVDYVVFLVDTSTRASWQQLQASVRGLDSAMLSTRTTLVITGARSESAVAPEELEEFTDLYDLQPIYVNPKELDGCRVLCKRLQLPLEVAAGYHSGITPTVLRGTDYERVYTTAYEDVDEDSAMPPASEDGDTS